MENTQLTTASKLKLDFKDSKYATGREKPQWLKYG